MHTQLNRKTGLKIYLPIIDIFVRNCLLTIRYIITVFLATCGNNWIRRITGVKRVERMIMKYILKRRS